MKGPVAVMMVVSVSSKPVLKRAGVKLMGGARLVLELCDVRGGEGETPRLWLVVLCEGFLEAEFAIVLAALLEGVDEEEVGAGGGEDPAAVGRDVHTDDGVAKRGNERLCVDA